MINQLALAIVTAAALYRAAERRGDIHAMHVYNDAVALLLKRRADDEARLAAAMRLDAPVWEGA